MNGSNVAAHIGLLEIVKLDCNFLSGGIQVCQTVRAGSFTDSRLRTTAYLDNTRAYLGRNCHVHFKSARCAHTFAIHFYEIRCIILPSVPFVTDNDRPCLTLIKQ